MTGAGERLDIQEEKGSWRSKRQKKNLTSPYVTSSAISANKSKPQTTLGKTETSPLFVVS